MKRASDVAAADAAFIAAAAPAIAAERDRLKALCVELLVAFKDMADVAAKAILKSGTDAEYAASQREAVAVIAKANGVLNEKGE